MFHHQMSLKMKHNNCTNCRNCCRFQRQFLNFLTLSIICTMMFTQTMARPNIDALLSNRQPTHDFVEQQQQQDFYVDDIATNINNEKLFNKMQKYHHIQPNYMKNWPGLRDLVSAFDYDNNNINNNGMEESNEFLNTRFFERLKQLASSKTSYDDELRLESGDARLIPAKTLKSYDSANQLSLKDHNIKKNVQYMSPCHFKICNMGRKRNARFFTSI